MGLSLRNSSQNCVQYVSGTLKRDVERGGGEGLEIISPRTEVDGVFFCGYKAARVEFVAHCKQPFYIGMVVGVVVAKLHLRCGQDSSGAHLGEELLWPGDSA